MTTIQHSWQLDTPAEAFVFDCDGTLTALEGIDELARMNGAGEIVQRLTADAMGQSGLNVNLYEKRLALVKPTFDQIHTLGKQYIAHCVPHIAEVIRLLRSLNKEIYIVSAGLYPAVVELGNFLGISAENIYAVNIYFKGNDYTDFDRQSPLVNNDGKRFIINQLSKKHARIIHVGDGMNDYSAHDLVTRFVGYGGVFYHQRVAEACQYYIACPSMAALLPLVLTSKECEDLTEIDKKLYQQGIGEVMRGKVIIKSQLI